MLASRDLRCCPKRAHKKCELTKSLTFQDNVQANGKV